VNLAGAEEWAGTLAEISNGNIQAKVFPLTSTLVYGPYMAQGANPMAVSFQGWSPDYPDASDYGFPFYGDGGFLTSGDNLGVSTFASTSPQTANDVVHVNGTTYTQDKVYAWMTGNITLGSASINPAVRQRAYETATKLGIDMGLYVYIYQTRAFWFFRSWLKGYEMQENPIIGGSWDLVFYWLTKD
jgi:hypothetical protein